MSDDSDTHLGRREMMAGLGVATVGLAAVTAGPIVNALRAQAARDPEAVEREALNAREARAEEARRADERAHEEEVLSAHGLQPASQEVRSFLGPVEPGTVVEGYWRVEAVYDVRAGAIPVVMSTRSGDRFLVELFRAGQIAPLSVSGPIALFLSNHGDGSARTDEAAGLGTMALGRAIDERLRDGATVPNGLTSFEQRAIAFPNGNFDLPT